MKIIKKVIDNKIEYDRNDLKIIDAFLEKNNNNRIEVTFKKAESKRSLTANNFYWGVVIVAWNRLWTDYTPDKIHKVLGEELRQVLKDAEDIELEKKFKCNNINPFRTKGSSEMNTREFYEYVQRATLLLSEMGGGLEYHEQLEYNDLNKTFKGVKK